HSVDMIGRLWRYADRRLVMTIDHVMAYLDLYQQRSAPLDECTGSFCVGHNKSYAEAKIHFGGIIQNNARTAHRNFSSVAVKERPLIFLKIDGPAIEACHFCLSNVHCLNGGEAIAV